MIPMGQPGTAGIMTGGYTPRTLPQPSGDFSGPGTAGAGGDFDPGVSTEAFHHALAMPPHVAEEFKRALMGPNPPLGSDFSGPGAASSGGDFGQSWRGTPRPPNMQSASVQTTAQEANQGLVGGVNGGLPPAGPQPLPHQNPQFQPIGDQRYARAAMGVPIRYGSSLPYNLTPGQPAPPSQNEAMAARNLHNTPGLPTPQLATQNTTGAWGSPLPHVQTPEEISTAEAHQGAAIANMQRANPALQLGYARDGTPRIMGPNVDNTPQGVRAAQVNALRNPSAAITGANQRWHDAQNEWQVRRGLMQQGVPPLLAHSISANLISPEAQHGAVQHAQDMQLAMAMRGVGQPNPRGVAGGGHQQLWQNLQLERQAARIKMLMDGKKPEEIKAAGLAEEDDPKGQEVKPIRNIPAPGGKPAVAGVQQPINANPPRGAIGQALQSGPNLAAGVGGGGIQMLNNLIDWFSPGSGTIPNPVAEREQERLNKNVARPTKKIVNGKVVPAR